MKHSYDLARNITADRIYRSGKWKYTLKQGLGWGIFMFVAMTSVDYFVPAFRSWHEFSVPVLFISFIFWCMAGIGMGWMQWQRVKRRALRAEKPV